MAFLLFRPKTKPSKPKLLGCAFHASDQRKRRKKHETRKTAPDSYNTSKNHSRSAFSRAFLGFFLFPIFLPLFSSLSLSFFFLFFRKSGNRCVFSPSIFLLERGKSGLAIRIYWREIELIRFVFSSDTWISPINLE